jgi:hypothetical protein
MGAAMREILFEHAFVIEIVVCLIATIGMTFNIVGLLNALRDKHDLVHKKLNGARSLIANAAIQQESLRLAVQVLIMAMSIVHLIYPPPPPSVPYNSLWDGLVYDQIIMATITILLATKSVLDHLDRQRLLDVMIGQMNRRRANPDAGYYGPKRRGEDRYDH